MQKYLWSVVLLAMAVSLSFGVATATAAKGGNSENAKLCQKGGWMNLQGSDGTQFANEEECVSFGAHGGMIVPKPTCTAGSDNFSDDAAGSLPTTWLGGTIDTAYTSDGGGGGIRIQGGPFPAGWAGFFADGTHLLFTGGNFGSNVPFRLSFTEAVSGVELVAESNTFASATATLNAYDSSDVLVATDSETTDQLATLSVTSTSNSIEYFTVASNQANGIAFTNIDWACAA